LPDFSGAETDFSKIGDQISATGEKTFSTRLASVWRVPGEEAIQVALHCRAFFRAHHIAVDEMRSKARPEATRLINAEKSEIVPVEGTTHSLEIPAEVLPLGTNAGIEFS
jgi:hypothetical protein